MQRKLLATYKRPIRLNEDKSILQAIRAANGWRELKVLRKKVFTFDSYGVKLK